MFSRFIVTSARRGHQLATKSATSYQFASQVRFSSNKKIDKSNPPDEFFNAEVESDKEFLDIATSLFEGGLENIASVKDPLTWERINAAKAIPIKLEDQTVDDANDLKSQQWSDNLSEDITSTSRGMLLSKVFVNEDVGDHAKEFQNGPMFPAEYLNYTLPWRKSDALPNPQLANFISNTDPEKFGHDAQGLRTCPGKLQRKGKSGVLGCHKIDLDELNHLDVLTLRKYLTDDSEILARQLTGLCAKCQRQVAKTIKRARHLGILPHIGDYEVQEVRPFLKRDDFHDVVNAETPVISKTIL